MTNTQEVQCIQVGDEFHCVEDEAGNLMPTIGNLTEQCDNCGSSEHYERDIRHDHGDFAGYTCVLCARWYPVEECPESDVVFYGSWYGSWYVAEREPRSVDMRSGKFDRSMSELDAGL